MYSDSSEHSESDDELDIQNAPLYTGSKISLLESVLALLGLKLAFKLPNVVFSFLIKFVVLLCPQENNCITSLHRFQKVFSKLKTPLIKHYYCCNCKKMAKDPCKKCQTCDLPISYFIEIPIIAQLIIMFKRQDFFTNLLHKFNRKKIHNDNLEDIYDGQAYRELFDNNGFLSKSTNISFMWNSDGVPLFKS